MNNCPERSLDNLSDKDTISKRQCESSKPESHKPRTGILEDFKKMSSFKRQVCFTAT